MDSIYKSLHPERFTIYASFSHSHTEKAQATKHGAASQPAAAILGSASCPKLHSFPNFFNTISGALGVMFHHQDDPAHFGIF